ncbi:flagellar FliJ family protein [Caenispirillum salinarum]|uniref:flagellar FliJ family protein n=1 Tax=Caenispirillum salinarum TaxID=859058 RepID=UPI00384CE3AD
MADRGLRGLIRLHKHQVDEKRRALADLERTEQEILDRQQALREEMVREQAAVREDPALGLTFGAYVQRHKERQERLAQSLANIRKAIEAARDDLSEAFKELKTYEITQANRDLREKHERDRKEQEVLDEIGLTLHRRREQAEDDGGDGSGGI